MSMDNPNEMEQAIEAYAAAKRELREAQKHAKIAADKAMEAANVAQELWRPVSLFIRTGQIKPGVYRINKGPGLYAEALMLDADHDYPDLLEMFR